MKDHEVTREQPLLDESGRIAEPGWARRQIWKYDREKIRASAFRIRERDRYVVMGDEFGAVFTLADNGYFGLQSVSLADFRDKRDHTETMLSLFPMGKMKMPPSSSQGDVIWKDKRLRMEFRPDAGRRKILCDMKEFWQGKPFYCEITLEQPESDSIVTAASRRGGKTFCYEQKINCMRAEGYLLQTGHTGSIRKKTTARSPGNGASLHGAAGGTGVPAAGLWAGSHSDSISAPDRGMKRVYVRI